MENIWNEAQEKVHNGSSFRINLEKRDLVIDGKYIIKEGQYEGSLGYDTNFPVNDLLVMAEGFIGSIATASRPLEVKRDTDATSGPYPNTSYLKMICSTAKTVNLLNCV